MNVGDLGGNVRVVLVSATHDGPIAEAVLVWLPLSRVGDQAAQNTLYQNAFGVLMKTVNPNITPTDQEHVATKLGLSDSQPPFPVGTTANAELPPNRYQLEAVEPAVRQGAETLIGATAAG
jgi:hypothetical protein